MADLDLDAVRAARREAERPGKPPTVVFGGKTYTLPVHYPLAAAWAADEGDYRTFLVAMLGEEHAREFAREAEAEDFFAFTRRVVGLYVDQPGESPASSPSSGSTGGRSRPTSRTSTGSASARRAGARKR